MPQQTSTKALKSDDGSAAAAVSDDAPLPLPLPHMPPNHHTRGKRPSGLVLPRDVHHSVDGTPLPAPVKGDATEATNAPGRMEAAAAAAAAGTTAAAAPPAGVWLAAGRLPPGEISFTPSAHLPHRWPSARARAAWSASAAAWSSECLLWFVGGGLGILLFYGGEVEQHAFASPSTPLCSLCANSASSNPAGSWRRWWRGRAATPGPSGACCCRTYAR